MTDFQKLDLLFEQNHGIVKTAQVLDHGIAKHTLYAYTKKNGMEQVEHGIYISPDAWTDAMYKLSRVLGCDIEDLLENPMV